MTKTILITGASRGIGYQTALALAERNHHILAVARSREALEQLQQTHPDSISIFPTDLTHQTQLRNLFEFIAENAREIDVLINNAGALINKPFEELTSNDWQKMIDVNLLSVINLTRGLIPFLAEQSHIVNISSMGGFQGSEKFPGLTAYSVAKGAVSILSECLAAELDQIRVNALCLGSVQTEMFATAFPDFKADVSSEKMGTYIAEFALNGSTYYNGKVLPVALQNPS